VLSADGEEPVAGARISLLPLDWSGRDYKNGVWGDTWLTRRPKDLERESVLVTVSDAEGKFRIAAPARDVWQVTPQF